MYPVKLASKLMLRRKYKSTIVLMVSLILVLFITLYASTIDKHLQTLDELYESIDVTAHITSWDGTSTENLNISKEVITTLTDSGFIGQEFYTRNLLFLTEPWDEDSPIAMSINALTPKLIGANDIKSIHQFSYENATMPEFLQGYDDTIFASEDKVAVVSTSFLLSEGIDIGDELELTVVQDLEDYSSRDQDIKHGTVSLKIVGQYHSFAPTSTVYMPWGTMDSLYSDLGISPKWDTARFILQNTDKLNEFRSLLRKEEFNFPGQEDSDRNTAMPGFVIQDRTLNNATGSITNYVDFMIALYPVIYILCAVIGFLVSYLLIRLRKPEFAIMRSLGTSKIKTFLNFFLEQSFLSTFGVVLSLITIAVMAGSLTPLQFYSVAGYLCSYWVGSAIAVFMMTKDNVVQILTGKE